MMNTDTLKLINFFKDKVQNCHILVIGDIMLDQYYYGNVTRISPEAPVPVNLVTRVKNTLGGAANVAHNLVKLGSNVKIIGVVGKDVHGKQLIELLKDKNIGTDGIVYADRKTTTKIRIIGGHQQMIRLDFEDAVSVDKSTECAILNTYDYELKNCNAVLLSDYKKGVCSDKICRHVIQKAHELKIPVFIDPKGDEWDKYKYADYITPNLKELTDISGYFLNNIENEIVLATRKVMKKYCLKNILVTRSEKGMTLVEDNSIYSIPTAAREVYDVSGAGDTAIATFTIGVAGGMDPYLSSVMANLAAGIGVSKVGTYAVSRQEMLARLK